MFAGRHSFRRAVGFFAALAGMLLAPSAQADKDIQWRYGHMNTPSSAAGFQAAWFAEAVEKNTNGQIKIKVYPSSKLGKTQELAKLVSPGTLRCPITQQPGSVRSTSRSLRLTLPTCTAISITSLNTVDVDSPVMKKLNDGLIKAAGVRVLYAHYFWNARIDRQAGHHAA